MSQISWQMCDIFEVSICIRDRRRDKRDSNQRSYRVEAGQHLSALQQEGLAIWDAHHQKCAISFLFLLLVLADAIGMAMISRSVGHHGRKGCRLFCGLFRHNKKKGSHYYPALLRPHNFEDHQTSSHLDVDINSLPIPSAEEYRQDLFSVIASGTEAERKRRQSNTGIRKPSIIDGIPRKLELPACFAGDLMHQLLINLAGLLLDLWCARPAACDFNRSSQWPWAILTGDIRENHGKVIEDAARYLPTSFGHAP